MLIRGENGKLLDFGGIFAWKLQKLYVSAFGMDKMTLVLHTPE